VNQRLKPAEPQDSRKSNKTFQERMKDSDFAENFRKFREADEIKKGHWKPKVD
jgi:hypothetical protein